MFLCYRSDYLWAHVVLRSRSHKLAVRDAVGQWHDAMCLIPLADLFNTNLHNNSANVACYTGSEGYGTMSVFYCETTRSISDGDEVCVRGRKRNTFRGTGQGRGDGSKCSGAKRAGQGGEAMKETTMMGATTPSTRKRRPCC